MEYKTLIKLCQKYNIDYKNHYGKNKSYIKLKRKVDEYQHNMNKKHKADSITYCQYFNLANNDVEDDIMKANCEYYNLNNDEIGTAIKLRLVSIVD